MQQHLSELSSYSDSIFCNFYDYFYSTYMLRTRADSCFFFILSNFLARIYAILCFFNAYSDSLFYSLFYNSSNDNVLLGILLLNRFNIVLTICYDYDYYSIFIYLLLVFRLYIVHNIGKIASKFD